jgi:hypothetical protein
MKTFVLSENGIKKMKQMVIKENNYSEHVSHGSDFLNTNYMRGTYDNGSGNIVGVFVRGQMDFQRRRQCGNKTY